MEGIFISRETKSEFRAQPDLDRTELSFLGIFFFFCSLEVVLAIGPILEGSGALVGKDRTSHRF